MPPREHLCYMYVAVPPEHWKVKGQNSATFIDRVGSKQKGSGRHRQYLPQAKLVQYKNVAFKVFYLLIIRQLTHIKNI